MTDIRPTDLPELRAELAEGLAGPDALWFYEDRAAALERRLGEPRRPLLLQAGEVVTLLQDDLYFIAPEMIELARAAAESLPPFTLEIEDLPSMQGFAYLGDGAFQTGTDLEPPAVMEWWVRGDRVRMNFFCDTEVMLARLLAKGSIDEARATMHRASFRRLSPMMSEAIIGFGHDPLDASDGDELLIRTFRAMWLLMQQPLAALSEVEPDRAARKRLRRAGHEPKPVRVIELRRPKSSGEPGESNRNYVHRWITRGHWRQQWYATRQVHRPVWIAPHVKGPEGAPLIGGEKVYAWKR